MMGVLRRSVLGVALLLAAVPVHASGWLEHSETGQRGANFLQARYHFRAPSAGEARGIVLLVPPPGEDGVKFAESGGWPAFADKLGYATLAAAYQGDEAHDFSNARRGSGTSLLGALRHFSDATGSRDLANLNMMVYGVAAGGQFAFSFTQDKPDRVFAFAAVLGAYWVPPTAAGRKTPGIFISADDQSDGAAPRTRDLVRAGRAYNAFWAWQGTPQRAGAASSTLGLVQEYFSGSLELRQSEKKLATGSPVDLSALKGWFMPSAGGTPLPMADVSRSEQGNGFWFPTEKSAGAWKPWNAEAAKGR